MKKTSIILTSIGLALLFLLFFCGVDVLDEQAFRWRLEYWVWAGAFVCFAAAMILCSIRARRMVVRIVWGLLALLPLYVVVDTVRTWPRLIYSDSHYQMWANKFDREYWKLYYGTGLVMYDAGGTPQPWDGELDSFRVELYDSLGVIWVETWSSYQGEPPFNHIGELVAIDSRFSKGNFENHTAELDSLLATHIHDSVEPGTWDKTRCVID